MNGALFGYNFDDLQLTQIQVNENGQTATFVGNAGKAERWGLNWKPVVATDDLMLSLTYSHIDGDFDEYAPLVGYHHD